MMTRIDWIPARTYFLSSETTTLRDCADRFNINYSSLRQKASDEAWSFQKQKIRTNALALLDETTTQEFARRKREQIQYAQVLLGKAAQALASGIRPKNAIEIQMWTETGVRIERLCLGLDKSGTISTT